MRLLRSIATVAASDETAANQVRDRFLAARRADLSQILQRAAARGEIDGEHAAMAPDLIYGSLWYRVIFRFGPLDYRWADAVADAIAPH